jgi:predicted RNA methylase
MRIRTVEISDEAAEVLRRGEWEGTLFKLPPGHLDRKLYEVVDKVLRALGGKWNRSMRGHLFTIQAHAELAAALEAGGVVDQKRTLEQFFTPESLANRMADWLGITDGTHVLEPSAGDGRLARAAIERGGSVTAIEIDECHMAALLDVADIRAGWMRRICADFMAWTKPAKDESNGDSWFPAEIDAVIMNPPFSNNKDIAHVRRAFAMLRPGGKLAAIMSPHFTFADDRPSREFRELIGYPEAPRSAKLSLDPPGEEVATASVELLPAGTFKAEGTSIAAVLVLIEKAR